MEFEMCNPIWMQIICKQKYIYFIFVFLCSWEACEKSINTTDVAEGDISFHLIFTEQDSIHR